MTTEKQDLRVIKTKERIEQALRELLKTKPLEKVTVTELARVAMINKGTFYLHYLDVDDLYKQIFKKCMEKPLKNADFFHNFFDDPERFLIQLGQALMSSMPEFQAIWQEKRHDALVFDDVRAMLCEKVYETGRIPRNHQNDMRLDLVFSALLATMPKYAQEAHRPIVSIIRCLFPEHVKTA